MLLDVKEIGRGGHTLDRYLELPALAGAGDEPIPVGRTRLVGRLQRGERGIDFHGRLDTTVRLDCGRCLEPFEAEIRTDFFLTIVADGTDYAPGEVELTPEDAHLFYATDGTVDLLALTSEQIYLNLPLKPICSPACRGLCPGCGINRNQEECACQDRDIDPRLAPLLDLKQASNED